MKRKDMYERIMKIMKKEDAYVDASKILDYEACSYGGVDEIHLQDVRDIVATECFGGNEGIYVDVYAYSSSQKMNIITFKTLDDNKDAWMQMGIIAALAGWAAYEAEWD